MTDLKGTNYWSICGDAYNFMKKYLPVQEDEKYWKSLTDEAKQISEKYKQQEEYGFAVDQILSVVTELDRIYMKQKRGEDKRDTEKM